MENSNYVNLYFENYKIVKDNNLPKTTTTCRGCQQSECVPTHMVEDGKGRKFYVMECRHCHQRHLMDVSDYKRRFQGFTNIKGDYIPPSTSGKTPRYIEEKRKKESEERQTQFFMNYCGITKEEAQNKVKEFDKQREKEMADFRIKSESDHQKRMKEYDREEMKEKSEQRKKLIAEGIIVYDKKNRCLYNTETGEIYK